MIGLFVLVVTQTSSDAADFGSAARALDSPMLVALAADGPTTLDAERSRTFDRFIGAWEFECTLYGDDGSADEFSGEWIFDWILDGRAIQDVWMGFKRGRSPGLRRMGTSLRFFDPKRNEWRVIFIVPASGKVIYLRGRELQDRIVLHGVDVDGASLRWSFNNIESNSFLWRGEVSRDAGKSWRVEQIMQLRRKRAT
jgi:hypothetical protein